MLVGMPHPFPHKQYAIIYADPPWAFKSWASGGARQCAGRVLGNRLPPYPCMRVGDICELPVDGLCQPDSILFLWAVYPMLPEAFRVIEAWGFSFKTVAFTWAKTNPSGTGYHFGLGFWTRANPEICLLATKGRPKRVSAAVPNLIVSPRRDHSRKPDEVRDRIVQLCGDLPRIELFARAMTPGWDAWGDELDPGSNMAARCIPAADMARPPLPSYAGSAGRPSAAHTDTTHKEE
jgi:N6-adenosine-specific RNA methylase IME4